MLFLTLLAVMLGLTLAASNLQGVLERTLIKVLLFWEKTSTKALLYKNLITHKQKNSLTSLVYTLALACIIFLLVTCKLILQTIIADKIIPGADLTIHYDGGISALQTD